MTTNTENYNKFIISYQNRDKGLALGEVDYICLIMHLIEQVPGTVDVPARLKIGDLRHIKPWKLLYNASEYFMLDPDDDRYIIKTSDYRKTLAHREKLKREQEESRAFHNTSKEYFQELSKAGIPRPIIDALMTMGAKKSLTELRDVIDKLLTPTQK